MSYKPTKSTHELDKEMEAIFNTENSIAEILDPIEDEDNPLILTEAEVEAILDADIHFNKLV